MKDKLFVAILAILDFFILKDPKKIILTSGNEKLQFNTKYFFEYLIKNTDYEIKYIINNSLEREKLKRKYGDYFIDNKALKNRLEILRSKFWFSDTSSPIFSFPNSKHIFINLWHGTPLKTVGILGEEKITFLKKIRYRFFSWKISYFIISSENLIKIYKKSFLLKEGKIKVLGQPRNDIFSLKEDIIRKKFKNIPNYKKVLLYAPTWRKGGTIFFPFKDYNYDDLNEFLEKNEYILFIKYHQHEKNKDSVKSNKRIIIIKDEIEDIMEIIYKTDLLITDYSSIYFDFLISLNPILFIPYDKNEYLNERGLNFDYDKITPGPKVCSFLDFKEEVLKLFNNKEYFKKDREKQNLYFNQITKNSCKLLKDFIVKL